MSKILLADQWTDYELLDCGNGMKQERWGDVVTVRPDPQVIWPRRSGQQWSNYDAFYERSNEGGGQWDYKRKLPDHWTIKYKDLSFKISPTDFKHTGLFPEQASNWDWLMKTIAESKRPVNVLNLFGYTGAATVACAKAGAKFTHVDAAKGMVYLCKENAKLSGLGDAPIRYIVEDCMKYVQREERRGIKYDGIIMDPPSYGRGKSGETWKLEKHLWDLLIQCRKVLSDKPLFFLLNSYTTGLSPIVTNNLISEIMNNYNGSLECGELGIPIKADGKILPCGIFARWQGV